ncbi:type II toxin-antitoxin system RatA family toxin [Streptomyces sp. SDr-06]|uniref:type II toxin-antitoxin system RatA family toxin n=1 Tax=Streptomyces sp. SDr-06 TaxID=2267702 RepID=UPI000DEBF626|nr:SRPBCC family protein [Streptomyces sp. SDr-06]RCH65701.1 cyclase [Streptomyces sp. SDr-06]
MRSTQLTVRVEAVCPGTAYHRIKDYARYPELAPVVRSVTVHEVSESEERSDWEVYFRNGILRWTETDRFDEARLRIVFRQLEGDFAEFAGTWSVAEDGGDCLVHFAAEFDFGIPSLAGILDPVAARVLKETIGVVVTSLFERAHVVGDEPVARAVARATVDAPARGLPGAAA